MKAVKALIACALVGMSFTVSADHWRSNHNNRHHKGDYEYWDGNCKVKREYKRNGRYKEKRDCRPNYHSQNRHYNHGHQSDRRHSRIDIPTIVIEPIIRIGG